MCGIVGYVGDRDAVEIILEGLKKLEYRGYDSAGVAVVGSSGLEIRRAAGRIKVLEGLLRERPVLGHRRRRGFRQLLRVRAAWRQRRNCGRVHDLVRQGSGRMTAVIGGTARHRLPGAGHVSGQRPARQPEERCHGADVIDNGLGRGSGADTGYLESQGRRLVFATVANPGRLQPELAETGWQRRRVRADDRVTAVVPLSGHALLERQPDARHGRHVIGVAVTMKIGPIERPRAVRTKGQLQGPQQAAFAAVVFADEGGTRVEAHRRGADRAQALHVQFAQVHAPTL